MKSIKKIKKPSKVMNQIKHKKGGLVAGKAKFGFVVADFNEYFTNMLLEGAVDTLYQFGVKPNLIDVYHVPGSFEIPLMVQKLNKKKKYDCLITLGMVIRGETRHFNHVVDAAAAGTMSAALAADIPVIHGVIAAENYDQAIDRCGGKMGHKGREAAKAAIEMTNLIQVHLA